ncbi:MAG: HAMP domain-containing histidine kinase [bacterium]|nr:HAMP domain-containing histidine kinase [bacterium]
MDFLDGKELNTRRLYDYVKSLERIAAEISESLRNHAAKTRAPDMELYDIAIKSSRLMGESEVLKEDLENLLHINDLLTTYSSNLKSANEFKDNLLQMVSHDLKSPLGSIIGFADLITRYPSRSRGYGQKIKSSGAKMLQLVEDLLDSQSLQEGQLRLFREEFLIRECLLEVLEGMSVLAAAKEQILKSKIDLPDDARLNGDEPRIKQMLENLIGNAIKFSPFATEILIRAENTPEHLNIYVQDEGPGITLEDQGHLFEYFRKLSARPTGGETSLGLGLYLVKQLVDLHGGRVGVESDGRSGSVFQLQLPKTEAEARQS